MPKIDKSAIKVGMFITGGLQPVYIADDPPAPVVYGTGVQRRPRPAPNFNEITERLAEARKRLDEIAAAVREAKRK